MQNIQVVDLVLSFSNVHRERDRERGRERESEREGERDRQRSFTGAQTENGIARPTVLPTVVL